MKRLVLTTWNRWRYARVRWTNLELVEIPLILTFVWQQVYIVGVITGFFPVADMLGLPFTTIYCATLFVLSVWLVPIDEEHYFQQMKALRARREGFSEDVEGLGGL
jgi:hypothetical protein